MWVPRCFDEADHVNVKLLSIAYCPDTEQLWHLIYISSSDQWNESCNSAAIMNEFLARVASDPSLYIDAV
jgi:hypothetical protein